MIYDQDKEFWRTVPDYPNYQVSNYGNIYNSRLRRSMQGRYQGPNRKRRVVLTNDHGRREFYIHHLVARTFMVGYIPGMQIMHVDGDTENNYVGNLAPKKIGHYNYPMTDRRRIPGQSRVYIPETGETFLNVYRAARFYQLDPSSIYKVLRRERRTCNGMTFRWVRDDHG